MIDKKIFQYIGSWSQTKGKVTQKEGNEKECC